MTSPDRTAVASEVPATLTGEQLAGVLGGSYGFTRHGRPNVTAAAKGFGCSRSTVYRWLNHAAESQAAIPAGRFRQLLESGRPSERHFGQEQLDRQRAADALAILEHPRSKAAQVFKEETAMWRRKEWDRPHYLAVIAHPRIGLVGLAATRARADLLTRASAGGTVRSMIRLPTRFAARLALDEVLGQVDGWRFIPAAMPYGQLRRTWLWLDGVEADLPAAADSAGVTVSGSWLSPDLEAAPDNGDPPNRIDPDVERGHVGSES